GVVAVHPVVHPELPGLLLGERAGAVPRPERPHQRPAVRAAEVVALSAAAVIEDRLTARGVAYREQPLGDLGDRRVPVDAFEGAVRAAAQRVGEAVRAVLIVVEPQRLLAGVALGGRVRLVTPDPGEPP